MIMKQVFSILAFCLVMSFSSGLMAQSNNTGRTPIPFPVACEIIDEAQVVFWNDIYKSTPELITLYQRGELTIIQLAGKGTFRVQVRSCIAIILLEDLAY